jgi:type I restriction enzyme, R subunit
VSKVGQRERVTQNRVAALLRDDLEYEHLGSWDERPENSNIEADLLRDWLGRRGLDSKLIGKALYELEKRAAVGGARRLYDANREIYDALRYGIKVLPDPGVPHETVWLIDWKTPQANDFAIAEEVTVFGEHSRRPDIVLYVNGIALGVIELKRSSVFVAEGIRQNLDSQKKEFIEPFFSTVQLLVAGNDTEGLRYGTIETREKYYLEWKEDSEVENRLDAALLQLCGKERLLELIHDFVVFDAGTKKLARHNQYFGVRAAQDRVVVREGGIIWHTQGSGKSLTMVWLAKWIRENITGARVLIVTDRTELDDQIEKVFKGVNEDIRRTQSGKNLVDVLNTANDSLICSLVHKFGASAEGAIKSFLADVDAHLPPNFSAKGEVFVFVDECHRTQSGDLHAAMKQLMPSATFIGFTGTPLLKSDKDNRTSVSIFGTYIHTYTYKEAVDDKVVLDLRYEARDIDQTLIAPDKVDLWFDTKTRNLTDVAKAQVKKRWGTMQKVLSAKQRLDQIVVDVCIDMETKPRLMAGHGNALLVSDSIYNACRFYELFQQTPLKGHCAIITSYSPTIGDIKGEESGEGETAAILQYTTYREMLADHFDEPEDTAAGKVELFEAQVKKRFIEAPAQMKLLIVVDKLLTGFNAPSATYLYIDKTMRDHGLFQAICRINRLDDETKEYGYVIDYKDLFKALQSAVRDFTRGAFSGFDADDVAGLLKDRLESARERLEDIRAEIKALCEPAGPKFDTPNYIRFFCAPEGTDEDDEADYERRRVMLYKVAGRFARAYADIASEMPEVRYSDTDAATIKTEVDHFTKLAEEIKLASGDYIDMKQFEPGMRQLLDTFIRADPTETVTNFDDFTLIELLVKKGEAAVDDLPEGIRSDRDAVAETIQNNVRKVIVEETSVNPKYYERMSELLDALVEARRNGAIDYKAYLAQIVELAEQVKSGPASRDYPATITSIAQRALYDNLGQDADLAVRLDRAIRGVKKDGWRGNKFKEKEVKNAISAIVAASDQAELIFDLAVAQHDY